MTELTALLRELRRAGYRVTKTHGSHWQIRDRRGRLVATTGSTPSDSRGLRNLRADLKRITSKPGRR